MSRAGGGLIGRHGQALWVGAAVLVLSTLAYVRVPLLPYLGDDLAMSAGDLGVATTVFALGRLSTDLPAGRLAGLRSVRWMLGGSAVLLGAASILLASAMVSAAVLLAFLLLGMSSAVVNTTGMVYFAESATTERRGRSMAGFAAALLGGQALGPAVGGVLASFWGWRAALVIGGALAVGLAFTIAVRARFLQTSAPPPPSGWTTGDGATGMRAFPLHEQAVLYFVPFAMFFTLGAMPQTLMPIIGAEEFDLTVGVIGLALGVGGACRFVGAVVGGVVSDHVSRKAALVPGLLAQALGVGLLVLEGSVWAWGAAVVVMSFASFSISVAATILVDRSGGSRTGRRLGPFRFAGDLGLIAGPFTASALYEHLGQRHAALAVAGVLLVAALAAAFGLRETRWLTDAGGGHETTASTEGTTRTSAAE